MPRRKKHKVAKKAKVDGNMVGAEDVGVNPGIQKGKSKQAPYICPEIISEEEKEVIDSLDTIHNAFTSHPLYPLSHIQCRIHIGRIVGDKFLKGLAKKYTIALYNAMKQAVGVWVDANGVVGDGTMDPTKRDIFVDYHFTNEDVHRNRYTPVERFKIKHIAQQVIECTDRPYDACVEVIKVQQVEPPVKNCAKLPSCVVLHERCDFQSKGHASTNSTAATTNNGPIYRFDKTSVGRTQERAANNTDSLRFEFCISMRQTKFSGVNQSHRFAVCILGLMRDILDRKGHTSIPILKLSTAKLKHDKEYLPPRSRGSKGSATIRKHTGPATNDPDCYG